LKPLDWFIVGMYAVSALLIGLHFTRLSSHGIESYFVGGRSLKWWAPPEGLRQFSPTALAASYPRRGYRYIPEIPERV
jgi:hypothetical protein